MITYLRAVLRLPRQILLFLQRSAIRSIVLLVLFFGYGWLSFIAYILFYRFYVPPVQHLAPLHLQFRSDCEEFICSFPQATVDLHEGGQAMLAPYQEYGITLEMDMPESQVNQDLGLFMVNLSFYSSTNKVLSSSARSVMIRYKSPLVKVMQIAFFAFPLVLGFSEEKQHLVVPLYSDFVDTLLNRAQRALLTVETKRVHVYSALLRLEARFSGLRYMMYYWPLTTAVFSISMIWFLLVALTALVFVRMWLRGWFPDFWDDEEEDEANGQVGADQLVVGEAIQLEQVGARVAEGREDDEVREDGDSDREDERALDGSDSSHSSSDERESDASDDGRHGDGSGPRRRRRAEPDSDT